MILKFLQKFVQSSVHPLVMAACPVNFSAPSATGKAVMDSEDEKRNFVAHRFLRHFFKQTVAVRAASHAMVLNVKPKVGDRLFQLLSPIIACQKQITVLAKFLSPPFNQMSVFRQQNSPFSDGYGDKRFIFGVGVIDDIVAENP